MAKAHHQSAVTPVAPRSAVRAANIDAITTCSTALGVQEPIQEEAQSLAEIERVGQWLLAVNPEVSVRRLRRIADGMRQITAPTPTLDGLRGGGGEKGRGEACPVTGKPCGEKGYGPYGIHSACARLDIPAYCE